jgi:hypothetical protein
MRCILPDPEYVTVSMDLAAGEPTVTAHFSGDKNYRYATIDGIGKAPFYDGPVLMIDDIYLMVASVSPLGRDVIWDTYHNYCFGDRTFVEQWLTDPEVVKTHLKKLRQFHKILCLGIGYSMGPRKCCKTAYENGFDLDFPTSKAFHRAYWRLFSGVKRLSDRLAQQVELEGCIVNPFGYRLTPEPRKAFNYFIQSSVSGIMHVFVAKLMATAPYAKFVTVIHDELVAECPVDRLDDFRRAKDVATDSLNEDLGWSVNIRTGFVAGGSWYEAK